MEQWRLMIFIPFNVKACKLQLFFVEIPTNRLLILQSEVSGSLYHLHSVAEEQAFGRDAANLVHESVLPREEALQAPAERAARCHAGLVELVEALHH